MVAKNGLLTFMCMNCDKNYEKKFNEYLFNRLKNAYQFCDRDIDKFCLIVRKGVYPYE